jgi:hypothetical protein
MAAGDCAWAVNTWERWQQALTSSQITNPLQAYHDVQIEATFWLKSGSTCTEPAEGTCTSPGEMFQRPRVLGRQQHEPRRLHGTERISDRHLVLEDLPLAQDSAQP